MLAGELRRIFAVPPLLPILANTKASGPVIALEGTVEITGDDLPGPTNLPKGGLFYGPRGRLHGFRNPTDTPSRLLVLMTPAAICSACSLSSPP
jgi:hypothetical protein